MAKSGKALMTPEVLKWAREERIKLSIDYAAKKLKVAPEQLEAWEHGIDQPTFAQLKRIANFYKTHISIFYLPGPPTGFQPLTDHRSLPESLKIDEDQAYRLNANILEAYERRETLIGLYELLEESPPQVTLKLSEADDPGYASQKIRSFLEFNRERLAKSKNAHAALKFWKQTVEAKGILACQTSANPHLSINLETARGFCIAQNPFPVIVVNSKDSPNGRIFTIIHELVHIALGKSVIQNTGFSSHPNLNSPEFFCTQVAAQVLVPEKEIYRNSHQEKDKDDSAQTGGCASYHNRLLNASGEHFARTAFTAYYEQKITLAELASVLSNSNIKPLSEIESAIFR
jgi:Zn-dependent peptidase ImmA (M78 family)